jgi:AAA+ superfamily predicted ATPase
MNINLKVEVPDSRNLTSTQKNLVAQIRDIVNNRVESSNFARAYKSNIFLYVLIHEHRETSEATVQLFPGLYVGADGSLLGTHEGEIFMTIMKNAFKSNLSIPEVEKNVIIYFASSEIDTKSLFEESQQKLVDFKAVDPSYTLDEVIMSPDERKSVMRAITLIRDKELIYDKWNYKKVDKNQKSILCFHGVPGTGKTMCAHGVASYLGKKIIFGTYNQIESEFVGVGAKNLVALFKAAQEQDAVLFIDEADTFLSKRLPADNASSKHYNSMSNELYTLIENFNGCIIFASNHIKDFDPAVISRIIEPIEFRLPTFEGRKAILNNMLQDDFPLKQGKTDEVLTQLAKATDGFSGRDIRKAIQISQATTVWKYKYELGVKDDEIVADISDLIQCINEVRAANEKIQNNGRSKPQNLLASFANSDKRNSRIIQLAAHTLLADGYIDAKEKELFSQLESSLHVTCELTTDKLPSVDEICIDVDTNTEKLELIDVVCRMSAIDGEIHEKEIELLHHLCDNLDIPEEVYTRLLAYSYKLAINYKEWSEISTSLGISDSEIIKKLQEEYNEGASYYRLSQYYRNGSALFGGISPNETKANKYEIVASDLGYRK